MKREPNEGWEDWHDRSQLDLRLVWGSVQGHEYKIGVNFDLQDNVHEWGVLPAMSLDDRKLFVEARMRELLQEDLEEVEPEEQPNEVLSTASRFEQIE